MCMNDDCHEEMDRRAFLVGTTAAAVALAASGWEVAAQPPAKMPETRVLDDARVQHGKVTFKYNGKDTFDGFLARPKAEGTYPAVLVIAGNRITEEYIPNTCAALALAGYVGLAPNIFHPLPDSAKTPEEMREASKGRTDFDVLLDVQVGADYLRAQPFVQPGGLGIIGFCYGGRIALLFASRSRDVDAVVPFHPGPVTAAEVARLKSPVQLHHGTADRAVDVAETKRLVAVLKAQKTPVELFLYEGADHGFLAYTRPARYNPQAAKLSWERTVRFLDGQLKS
jgi:carboxymethylenebutenolidase